MRSQPSYARYEWTPYVPKHMQNETRVAASQPPVYILNWSGRGAQFQNMDEASVHKIEYLHPYMMLPQVVENQTALEITCVDFEWKTADKTYSIVFDKEIDRLASFIPDFCEDNSLPLEETQPLLKEALQEAFRAKRESEGAHFREQQDQVAAMSPETNAALRAMRTFKFYPWHPSLVIDSFINDQINPYLGVATKVVVPSAEDAALLLQEQKEIEEASTPKRKTPKRTRREDDDVEAAVATPAPVEAAPAPEAALPEEKPEEPKRVKVDEGEKE